MTESEELVGPRYASGGGYPEHDAGYPATEAGYAVGDPAFDQAGQDGCAGADDLFAVLDRLNEGQDYLVEQQQQLRDEFERLAVNLTPLLTKQFESTLQRMRVLETRLRNRQERPLLLRIAALLGDVRRLESADDVKAHVEEALLDALHSTGYQEIGLEGEPFDPRCHEPMSGSAGQVAVVRQVYSRGLACHGDVLVKAKVDVAPNSDDDPAQGRLPQ